MMSEPDPGQFDQLMAEVDAALPPLLREQVRDPRWPRRLRRRLRRERWAQRLEALALVLQLALLGGVAALFHPWRWNWTAGGLSPALWAPALGLALILIVVGATACWSATSLGGAGR